ncbi:hypothetical protein UFOVP238_52 [uncultured Caudovirales phage]|uniref:Uncharacterized protein n=1 Tax=uncultured Caudovirales phage TaxID=2100421 RepID=A0A6J7WRJ7_9CAUD|nr:hypothetical protein UFOVP238_52 [uncultured Caudovirales phage]
MIQDLATYIDTQISSLTLATNLFIGFMPTNPDTAVSIYETTGKDEMGMGGPVAFRTADVQVITRAITYVDTETLALTIHSALNALRVTVGSKNYVSFTPIARPALFERDSNDRYLFTGNYEVRW